MGKSGKSERIPAAEDRQAQKPEEDQVTPCASPQPTPPASRSSVRWPTFAPRPGAASCGETDHMKTNIQRFGKLKDDGDTGDHKRTFVVDDTGDSWKRIAIEINTDDCCRKHAKAFKKALIKLWNSQP